MSYVSPTTWILYGLGGSQLADSQVPFIPATGSAPQGTVGDFVQSYFGYHPDFIWWCPLIILAYIMFFRGASVVIFSYVSFNKR